MNKNKFLIFSGIGDISNQFLSWASEKSNVYDRAIFYYGDKKTRRSELQEINTEYFFNSKGMIWENFSKLYYDFFSSYEYVLVCDSDIILDKKSIEFTFHIAEKKKFTACTWAREGSERDFGYFSKVLSSHVNSRRITSTNFIEMIFMLIRKDLIEILIKDFNKLELKYSTGVDIVLSSSAYLNKMLPFKVLNTFKFYNPHPAEKGVREIDFILEADGGDAYRDRVKTAIEKIINSQDHYYIDTIRHENSCQKLFTNIG